MKKYGIDADDFWANEATRLLKAGYEPTSAYLNSILDHVGEGKTFGALTNSDLLAFGASIEKLFYPGVKSLFPDLRKIVKDVSSDLAIEFYIISGGIQPIIEGSQLVQDNFAGVYGCQFGEDAQTGVIKHIKRTITFTEKTRYLFEINKGLKPKDTFGNPYAVNREVPESRRRIPFQNMIYVGDGLTDIPCFSLLKRFGGYSFGVFHPGDEKSAKKAFTEFLKTDRVLSTHAPRYTKSAELGALLRSAVSSTANRILLERNQPENP